MPGLVADYPGLDVHGVVADFERHLDRLPTDGPRLVAFLGGTIGNFEPDRARGLPGRGRRHPRARRRAAARHRPGQGPRAAGPGVRRRGRRHRRVRPQRPARDQPRARRDLRRRPLRARRRVGRGAGVDRDAAALARRRSRSTCPRSALTVDFAAGEEMRTEISAKFRQRRASPPSSPRPGCVSPTGGPTSRVTSRCPWRWHERASAARFVEDFDGDDARPERVAAALPAGLELAGRERRRPAPSRGRSLTLSIPPEQGLWCAGDHEPPLRVSGDPVRAASRDRWAAPPASSRSATARPCARSSRSSGAGRPTAAASRSRARLDLSPRSMASVWMVGLEDRPDRCAEICVFEIFGDAVDPAAPLRSARASRRSATPRSPRTSRRSGCRVDVAQWHTYAVDWDRGAGHLLRRRRGRPRPCPRPPAYPLQLMVAVFDFPDRSAGDDGHARPPARDRPDPRLARTGSRASRCRPRSGPPRPGWRRRSCRSPPTGGCGPSPRTGTAGAATTATDAPSRAARSTSVSRAVSGESPATRLSAASTGSTTRSPACTRRTASASCRAGVSLTTNPSAPACSARRR